MNDQPQVVTAPRATTKFWKRVRDAGGLPYQHEVVKCCMCDQPCVIAPSSKEALDNGAALYCWDVCWRVFQEVLKQHRIPVNVHVPEGQDAERLALQTQMRRN